MENSPIGRTHKIQIGASITVLLIILLAYTGYGLAQGFDMANQHIANHPLNYIYLLTIAIATLPVQSKLWTKIKRISYQAGWTGTILLFGSIIVWIGYGLGTGPQTLLGSILEKISYLFTIFALGTIIIPILAPNIDN